MKRFISRFRCALACIVTAMLMSLALLQLTAQHWWKQDRSAVISVDGVRRPGEVYVSDDGQVNARIDGGMAYLIQPFDNKVSVGFDPFFWYFPGYAYARRLPPYGVPISESEIKSGHDPKLTFGSNSVSFYDDSNAHIMISVTRGFSSYHG